MQVAAHSRRVVMALTTRITKTAGMAALVLALTGCGRATQTPGSSGPTGPHRLVLVSAAGELRTLLLPGGQVEVRAPKAVAIRGGRALLTITRHGTVTSLDTLDPTTGARWASRPVPPGSSIQAAAGDGSLAALAVGSAFAGDGGGYGSFVIADPAGLLPLRTFQLSGRFVPEAFSTDDRLLYLIEYLAAANPPSYRVRALDLATGVVSGVVGRDKEPPDEQMSGFRGQQVLAPDGKTLYTLYLRPGGPAPAAEVHTLSLSQGWAHCVDLPSSFSSAASDSALAVAPDGSLLYVLGAAGGRLAEVDTATLQVVRVWPVPVLTTPSARPAMVAGPHGELYIASGRQLVRTAVGDAGPARAWTMRSNISSLVLSPAVDDLFVVSGHELAVLDLHTGQFARPLAVPGIIAVDSLL